MTEDREVKRARIAMGREFGASPAARGRMKEADEQAIWWTECRFCRRKIEGTPAQLLEQAQAHICIRELNG